MPYALPPPFIWTRTANYYLITPNMITLNETINDQGFDVLYLTETCNSV